MASPSKKTGWGERNLSPLFYINTRMIILKRKEIVLVGIIYYLPDHRNLVNEFYCHFEDIVPEIPRVHEFLNFWKNNIDAMIKQIEVSSYGNAKHRTASFYKVIH
jgi:uncharacterized protein Usg